jgi:hypothetical protein
VRARLAERLLAARDVARDLEVLSAVLGVAADHGIDFSLTLRIQNDSLQVVSSMERRHGRFW